MQALRALTALNALLLAMSGLFAFIVLGSGLPQFRALNATGLAYIVAAVFLPLASLVAIILTWQSSRRGRVRSAMWIASSPLVAATCCILALIGFHLAVSLTRTPL